MTDMEGTFAPTALRRDVAPVGVPHSFVGLRRRPRRRMTVAVLAT